MDPSNFFIALMLVVMIVAIIFGVIQSKTRDGWMENAAQQRGGEIRKGSFFVKAELLIPCKDQTIVIQMHPGGKNSSPKTIAIANVNKPLLPTLRMTRNGLWQKMMDALGQERVITGDDDFDNEWVIRSADEIGARKLSSPDLKDKLSDYIFRHMDLRLEPKQMAMTALANPSNEEQFNLFIDTAILILKKFV